MKVAIAGLGPKGLYALERLIHHADERAPGALDVVAYEPHPSPGAGPVYDPTQPEFLRMNFAAPLIDMWPKGSEGGPSFEEWRAAQTGLADDAYPPRAHVGRYLADGCQALAGRSGDAAGISLVPEPVRRIEATGDRWRVHAGGSDDFDEVLIAVGHATDWDGALAHSATGPRTIPAVFPVTAHLNRDGVPPGSRVAIRGFALTMIDAALALTEGRGGRFEAGAEGDLSYVPGGEQAAKLLPYSRTGRPMLAKPDPAHAISSPELESIAEDARTAIRATAPGAGLAPMIAIIGRLASGSLAETSGGSGNGWAIERLERAARGEASPSDLGPADELERSLLIATGRADPGEDWALGHGWRAIYPALVERLGAEGLDTAEWPSFRLLAAEMERIAFGPPPVNAAKLLALVRHGVVDLSALRSGADPSADVVVDAVVPAPGALGVHQPVLSALLQDGHVRVPPGRRGLELSPDVTCIGAGGHASYGLGAIGRPTEDWVIGNDTLNRELHPQPDLWARRVVDRIAGA